jgi:hypothetical protein
MSRQLPGTWSRRDFIKVLTMAGGAAAIGLPGLRAEQSKPSLVTGNGAADKTAAHAHDWAWLVGNWDVWHRRLKERLVGDTHWQEFPGKSALWLAMGGQATIDDNIVELPDGAYRGLTLRTYDPATDHWSIWWMDGRDPTAIEPPVQGGFQGDIGIFMGRDTFNGRPILVRFRWQDIHGKRPWWEQAFSTDDGASWEVNWRNYFTRTAAAPTPLPTLAGAPRDFDFLVGSWNVQHRRLRHRLVNSHEWDSFDGTLINWPTLGGYGNVGDNVMALPAGTVRGIGMRAFDTATKQWLSWWIDNRTPTTIQPPLRGSFVDGVGTFISDDTLDGRPIKTRVIWSHITARSARWEQSCSADGGTTWELNWVSDFTRKA